MRGCTSRRTGGFPLSLPSIENMCPAMRSSISIGRCLARTDRYYVKQYEQETNLRADDLFGCFVVDGVWECGGGEGREGAVGPAAGTTKFEYASGAGRRRRGVHAGESTGFGGADGF